ncbi:unnamed protein product, partial [Ixodes pacificus]
GFIVLYIAFILVVVLSRLVYQRFKESEAGEAANSSAAARPGPQTWAGTLLRKFKEGLCTSAKDPPVQAKNCKMFNNNTIDDAEMGVVLRRK